MNAPADLITRTSQRLAALPFLQGPEEARAFIIAAGLGDWLAEVSLHGAAPATFWTNFIWRLGQTGQTAAIVALLSKAQEQTGLDVGDELAALKREWQAQPAGGGSAIAPASPQVTLPISDVQLRDFIVEHFTKRDLADLLLGLTDVLRRDGKLKAHETVEIDTFSSTSEPFSAIARELVGYFRRRVWTACLVAAVRAARPEAFRAKFGADS